MAWLISRSRWQGIDNMINVLMEHGKGKEYIYVYYYPSQFKDYGNFPCKIGKSTIDPIKRILANQSAMQEKPIVGLLIRTDNCHRDERILHTILRDDKLETFFGNEWFQTNPKGVLNVYKNMLDELTLGMQLRIARLEEDMTQEYLAECAGLRQATISSAENDENIQTDTLNQILIELKKKIILIDEEE